MRNAINPGLETPAKSARGPLNTCPAARRAAREADVEWTDSGQRRRRVVHGRHAADRHSPDGINTVLPMS